MFEKILHWYYKTFVEWGDRKFSIENNFPFFHTLWMWTVGFPFTIRLFYIWYKP